MYKLVSREKLKRVKRTLSEKATEKEILVEYDRIGGLIEEITKNCDKRSTLKNIQRSKKRGIVITEIKSDEDIFQYYKLQKQSRIKNLKLILKEKKISTSFQKSLVT